MTIQFHLCWRSYRTHIFWLLLVITYKILQECKLMVSGFILLEWLYLHWYGLNETSDVSIASRHLDRRTSIVWSCDTEAVSWPTGAWCGGGDLSSLVSVELGVVFGNLHSLLDLPGDTASVSHEQKVLVLQSRWQDAIKTSEVSFNPYQWR